MSELVTDCPRCGASNTTFDIYSCHVLERSELGYAKAEAHGVCRRCKRGTIFNIENQRGIAISWMERNNPAIVTSNINDYVEVLGFISLKDKDCEPPPQDLPAPIAKAWHEGARCMAVDCPNAAGAMFRLCIDLATKAMLPAEDGNGLNAATRRSLGLRLEWLFSSGKLPIGLQDLSRAVKDDGNDGAHDGTLSSAEGADLQDFTFALLDRIYSEPARIAAAQARRAARRSGQTES